MIAEVQERSEARVILAVNDAEEVYDDRVFGRERLPCEVLNLNDIDSTSVELDNRVPASNVLDLSVVSPSCQVS